MKNYMKSFLVVICVIFMSMGIGGFFNEGELSERILFSLVCIIGGGAGIWLVCFSDHLNVSGLNYRGLTPGLIARSGLLAVFAVACFLYMKAAMWSQLVPGMKGLIIAMALTLPLMFIYHIYLYVKQERKNVKG
ncbi:MAG: hypothetical protein IKX74_02830 [Erysipelotrichaceae bacterium]|nr:hypothetical protein [Erysipelotrichaceae bacterium]MBR5048569.1 hypothetical protein [Erysipelotrichaceae bacterium]